MPFKKPHHKSDGTTQREGNNIIVLPKGLNIVWGNDQRYWKLEDYTAELIQVSWLEVSGMVSIPDAKKYRVAFEVRVKDDGFGWNGTDVLVMAKIGKRGRYTYKVVNLSPGRSMTIPPVSDALEMDIIAPSSELHFGLYEVWSGKWKGGLEITKAVISPVSC